MSHAAKSYRFVAGVLRSSTTRLLCVALASLVLCIGGVGCSDPVAEADSLVAEQDFAGAEALYREALEADPANLGALSGLALALALQSKYDEALSVQEQVVAADPSDSHTRVELGFNYLNHQDRADDAVRVLSEAAELDRSAKNLTFLAQAQAVAGMADEAEQTLELALETDPQYEYAYRVLVHLLDDLGRQEEADEVIGLAASRGITIADS